MRTRIAQLAVYIVPLLTAGVSMSCVLLTDFDGLTLDGGVDAADAAESADASQADGWDGEVGTEEPGVPVPIASCEGNAWALAVDGDELFWTSHQVANGTSSGSKIYKAKLDCRGGACGTELVFLPASPELTDIAVDASWVYFGEKRSVGRILRVGRNGGTPEVLAEDQANAFGLAIDSSHVYWTGKDPQQSGYLRRTYKNAALDGGGAQAETLLAELDTPGLLTWDSFSGWLFWGSNAQLAIRKCYPMILDGGQSGCEGATLLASRPDLQLQPGEMAEVFKLATDQTHVYWREGMYSQGAPTSGSVRKVAKDGSEQPEIMADGDPALKPRWISLRGDYAYWTGFDGKVYFVNKTGGPVEALNDEPVPGLHSVVALNDAVYVNSWTSCAVYRIPL